MNSDSLSSTAGSEETGNRGIGDAATLRVVTLHEQNGNGVKSIELQGTGIAGSEGYRWVTCTYCR